MDLTRAHSVRALLDTVIYPGYCIGCGACAALDGSPLRMTLDPYGRFVAELAPGADPDAPAPPVAAVCPFSQIAANEDAIARDRFPATAPRHDRIGCHVGAYAGYVAENAYRERGSSGGMGAWLLAALLERGLIDAAIHVQARPRTQGDPLLFDYRIVHSVEAIRDGAKSRYYPIQMADVLREVRRRPGRYALVGLPCFLKAFHLVAQHDPVLRDRIRYTVGLVCGHLKSARFADMFAWQCGIAPGCLLAIDFRKKLPGRSAREYGMEFEGFIDGEIVRLAQPRDAFYGFAWGWCLFKYNACDFCDDVLAETADATVGDAWLPRYIADEEGTNVLVTRTPEMQALVLEAQAQGRLVLDPVTPDEVAQSQEAGLRHRREGLAYRLYLKEQAGQLCPPKRVAPRADHLDDRTKRILELRVTLMDESHTAFAEAARAGAFEVFVQRMEPAIGEYKKLYEQKAI